MPHVAHVNESCHTRVAHMNESCHTCEWDMSHIHTRVGFGLIRLFNVLGALKIERKPLRLMH